MFEENEVRCILKLSQSMNFEYSNKLFAKKLMDGSEISKFVLKELAKRGTGNDLAIKINSKSVWAPRCHLPENSGGAQLKFAVSPAEKPKGADTDNQHQKTKYSLCSLKTHLKECLTY